MLFINTASIGEIERLKNQDTVSIDYLTNKAFEWHYKGNNHYLKFKRLGKKDAILHIISGIGNQKWYAISVNGTNPDDYADRQYLTAKDNKACANFNFMIKDAKSLSNILRSRRYYFE